MFKKIYTIALISTIAQSSIAETTIAKISDFDIALGGEFGVELGGRIQNKKYTKKKCRK